MANQPILQMSTPICVDGFTEQVPVLESQAVEVIPTDIHRMFFSLHNEAGILYVRFGEEEASRTDYTYRLTPNSILENNFWRGRVTAIKEQGDSVALLTVAFGGY